MLYPIELWPRVLRRCATARRSRQDPCLRNLSSLEPQAFRRALSTFDRLLLFWACAWPSLRRDEQRSEAEAKTEAEGSARRARARARDLLRAAHTAAAVRRVAELRLGAGGAGRARRCGAPGGGSGGRSDPPARAAAGCGHATRGARGP